MDILDCIGGKRVHTIGDKGVLQMRDFPLSSSFSQSLVHQSRDSQGSLYVESLGKKPLPSGSR